MLYLLYDTLKIKRLNSTQNYREDLLKSLDQEFKAESFIEICRDGNKKAFTRERFFNLKRLIVVIMLLKASYQKELDKFCQVIVGGDFEARGVSKSALTQSRAKLNPEAFQRLNEVSIEAFYDGAGYSVWKGMRVLAVDGSRLKLPNSKSIREEFGEHGFGPKADSKASIATCSLLYDVLNHVTLDARIGSYVDREKDLLDLHMPKLREGDLLLADRGYPSAEVMLKLKERNVNFCFRIGSAWNAVKEFTASKKKQAIVELDVPRRLRKQFHLEKGATIKVRLLRIDIGQDKPEILCTSLLDTKKYPYKQFKVLYHLRWGVEEAYKIAKARIQIEAFSGKTARSVRQDFHAKILLMTLSAALAYPVAQKVREEYAKEATGLKHDQVINRTNAIASMKSNLVNLLIKMHFGALDCMDAITGKTREPVRPGRTVPRRKRPPKRHYTNYKPVT